MLVERRTVLEIPVVEGVVVEDAAEVAAKPWIGLDEVHHGVLLAAGEVAQVVTPRRLHGREIDRQHSAEEIMAPGCVSQEERSRRELREQGLRRGALADHQLGVRGGLEESRQWNAKVGEVGVVVDPENPVERVEVAEDRLDLAEVTPSVALRRAVEDVLVAVAVGVALVIDLRVEADAGIVSREDSKLHVDPRVLFRVRALPTGQERLGGRVRMLQGPGPFAPPCW